MPGIDPLSPRVDPANLRTRAARGAHVVVALSILIVTGCATGGEDSWNSTAVGDDESIGSVDLRSVLLVTSDQGEPARMLGTLENNSDESVDLMIRDADEDITVSIPAQGSIPLDTTEILLRTAGDAPGARTTLTATTSEGDVELVVPVVDGTLNPYQPYLPQ